jgi:hypothetical protein
MTKRRRFSCTSSPLIGSLVVMWRQELADKIAVGTVDLHTTETGLLADGRASPKAANDVAYLIG